MAARQSPPGSGSRDSATSVDLSSAAAAKTPSLVPKRRSTVCNVTPARAAMVSRVMSSGSCSRKSSTVASTMRRRVSSAAAARATIWYGRFFIFALVLLILNQRMSSPSRLADEAEVEAQDEQDEVNDRSHGTELGR